MSWYKQDRHDSQENKYDIKFKHKKKKNVPQDVMIWNMSKRQMKCMESYHGWGR